MSTQCCSSWTLTKSAWSVKAIAGRPISIARSQLRSIEPRGPSYDHSVCTWRSGGRDTRQGYRGRASSPRSRGRAPTGSARRPAAWRGDELGARGTRDQSTATRVEQDASSPRGRQVHVYSPRIAHRVAVDIPLGSVWDRLDRDLHSRDGFGNGRHIVRATRTRRGGADEAIRQDEA